MSVISIWMTSSLQCCILSWIFLDTCANRNISSFVNSVLLSKFNEPLYHPKTKLFKSNEKNAYNRISKSLDDVSGGNRSSDCDAVSCLFAGNNRELVSCFKYSSSLLGMFSIAGAQVLCTLLLTDGCPVFCEELESKLNSNLDFGLLSDNEVLEKLEIFGVLYGILVNLRVSLGFVVIVHPWLFYW